MCDLNARAWVSVCLRAGGEAGTYCSALALTRVGCAADHSYCSAPAPTRGGCAAAAAAAAWALAAAYDCVPPHMQPRHVIAKHQQLSYVLWRINHACITHHERKKLEREYRTLHRTYVRTFRHAARAAAAVRCAVSVYLSHKNIGADVLHCDEKYMHKYEPTANITRTGIQYILST